MNETPTPTPPEQNPSSDSAVPLSRRELRAENAHAHPGMPAQPPTGVPGATDVPAAAIPGSAPLAAPGEELAGMPHAVPPVTGAPVTAPDFGPANPPLSAPETLDQGTFDRIREPRGEGLALDGTWHQISKKYVLSQILQNLFWLVVVLVIAAVITLTSHEPWAWIPAGVVALGIIFSLIITPRQAKALGYMLRGDDVVFRKGILWQRMIAVPYGRMQLVDISHGPLDRVFGVAKLKMVTAAASTGVEIPGLTTAGAEALRDTLIEVAETRRTGL